MEACRIKVITGSIHNAAITPKSVSGFVKALYMTALGHRNA